MRLFVSSGRQSLTHWHVLFDLYAQCASIVPGKGAAPTMGLRGLVPVLCLLSLLSGLARAIEVKWTPADGDGPEPASKRYRESMVSDMVTVEAVPRPQMTVGGWWCSLQARLRELEAEQAMGGMTEQQKQQMMMQQKQMLQQQMMQQQAQQRPPPSFFGASGQNHT